jgi:hypothetical protein
VYSGTTFTPISGRIFGTHQKIDRVARRHLALLLKQSHQFPSISSILHFEGYNGPDAIKRKSPAKDEPWHYYNPFDPNDSQLIVLIQDHYNNLVKELKAGNRERTAFEAAWLAHALVDGLTPAHHYPYEEKLIELRGGEGIETRTTIKDKLVMTGNTPSEKLMNNWKMWGPKGLFTTHGTFEMGIASITKPLSFSDAAPNKETLKKSADLGVIEVFKRTAREIGVMEIFKRYYETGWTGKLSVDVRQKLMPSIIQTVTIAWYLALVDAGMLKKPS